MMDYSNAAVAQQAAIPAQPVPELGHLKAAAERISQANYNLLAFHNRFFGPTPEANAKQGETAGCYRNDLTAVFDQIGQLEQLVTALNSIG